MQQWAKQPAGEDNAGNGVGVYRAGMARKPEPPQPAASTPSPGRQAVTASLSHGGVPAYGGAAPAGLAAAASDAGAEVECEGGLADWALNSVEKAFRGAEPSSGQAAPSSGQAAPSSGVPSHGSDSAGSATDQQASSRVEDSEPWVHKGSAGSGAEALARATLRSADMGANGRPQQQQQQRGGPDAEGRSTESDSGYWQSWSATLKGHTHDEDSSSDEDGDVCSPPELEPLPAQAHAAAAVAAAVPAAPELAPAAAAADHQAQQPRRSAPERPRTARSAFPQQTPSLADDGDYII